MKDFDAKGNTPIHHAAKHGDSRKIRTLVRDYVRNYLDLKNADGKTAFMLACENGHEAAGQALLDLGATLPPTSASEE